MRVYVVLGALVQAYCAIAYASPYIAVSVLLFVAVSYLLLNGTRWAWIASVAFCVPYLVLSVIAGWIVGALSYLVYLVLLAAPPSRRHFARRPPGPSASLGSRRGRLRASPAALKAFAAILLSYYVGALIFLAINAEPGPAPVGVAVAVAITLALGFFVAQGARVAWSIALALVMLILGAAIAGGNWEFAGIHLALLLLLLLPGSVAFVWRDRATA
jgi:hypothetical protein